MLLVWRTSGRLAAQVGGQHAIAVATATLSLLCPAADQLACCLWADLAKALIPETHYSLQRASPWMCATLTCQIVAQLPQLSLPFPLPAFFASHIIPAVLFHRSDRVSILPLAIQHTLQPHPTSLPPHTSMLQHKAHLRVQRSAAAASSSNRRVVVTRAASSAQQATGDYETLRGLKVTSAADGFEVDLLSLWQVGKT